MGESTGRDLLDFDNLVIQMLRYKVVDRRDITANGLVETFARLLFGPTTHSAAWERRTLSSVTTGLIPNYSDA